VNTDTHISPAVRRTAYAAASALLLAAIAFELARHATGWWQLPAFGLGPDLALLLGGGGGLARGQLHRRAVRLYNALHVFAGPLALGLLAGAGALPRELVVGSLVWAFHVALDRSLGYGLRTRDGFQRA
jgi:hypothetical protein